MLIITSELLCYAENNVGKFQRMQFITTINGFYKEKELLEAKAVV